jgi:hypothetical protein
MVYHQPSLGVADTVSIQFVPPSIETVLSSKFFKFTFRHPTYANPLLAQHFAMIDLDKFEDISKHLEQGLAHIYMRDVQFFLFDIGLVVAGSSGGYLLNFNLQHIYFRLT